MRIRVCSALADIRRNVGHTHAPTAKRKRVVYKNDIAPLRDLIRPGQAIVTFFLVKSLHFPR